MIILGHLVGYPYGDTMILVTPILGLNLPESYYATGIGDIVSYTKAVNWPLVSFIGDYYNNITYYDGADSGSDSGVSLTIS